MKRRYPIFVFAALAAALLVSCAGSPKGAAGPDKNPLELSIFHVNDTHAKLEPMMTELKVDIDDTLKGKRAYVELGGFPQLWTAINKLRAEHSNNLFLSAGDVFQGTLYFTQFEGKADLDFLNAMKLDGMALGNHEFDKGSPALAAFASGASFPIVCANIDVSADKALASLIKPYVIKNIDQARVGIIGLITPDTPYISSPGKGVVFQDPIEAGKKYVKELEGQGVNKIIVLSHMGYENDKTFAAKVSGVDVIVGGHSHTLLGDFKTLGKTTDGPYPTIVKDSTGADVLIVTSWQWANAVGELNLSFDKDGKVMKYTGSAKLPAGLSKLRVYDLPGNDGKMKRVEYVRGSDGMYTVKEYDGKAYAAVPADPSGYYDALKKLSVKFSADKRFLFVEPAPEGIAKLKTYSASIDGLKKKIATKAAEELKRFNNVGPGPLVADSMLWKTGADISIMNPGGVRIDMVAGDISVAQVYELQPFANTLMTIDLTGAEVVKALEDMTDFCITTYGKKPDTAYVYVAGVKMTLLVNEAVGARVKDVQVKKADGSYAAIDAAKKYKIVVNNFMGTGGDKNFTLGKVTADRKYDTGFIDSEVMLDYVLGKTLNNSGEERVKNQF
ncbi:MAG: 5'-nucleotidase C-terminal domain-containing protein [Treponemataceae bacterium]